MLGYRDCAGADEARRVILSLDGDDQKTDRRLSDLVTDAVGDAVDEVVFGIGHVRAQSVDLGAIEYVLVDAVGLQGEHAVLTRGGRVDGSVQQSPVIRQARFRGVDGL